MDKHNPPPLGKKCEFKFGHTTYIRKVFESIGGKKLRNLLS